MNRAEAESILENKSLWEGFYAEASGYKGLEASRLFARVFPRENGCWIYTGGLQSKGYGCISVSSKPWLAHRLAWTIANGAIPSGLLVCHHCDTRDCVNPRHLFLGSTRRNAHDALNKGRLGHKNVGPTAREYLEQVIGGAQ